METENRESEFKEVLSVEYPNGLKIYLGSLTESMNSLIEKCNSIKENSNSNKKEEPNYTG